MNPTNQRYRLLFIPLLVLLLGIQLNAQAQDAANPTPIVINLSPTVEIPTTVPTATSNNAYLPDAMEPNNSAENAAQIGWQSIQGLTLIGDDVDYFVGFLKTGQIVQIETTVYESLDTRLRLIWGGAVSAENDDASATNVGSRLIFTAREDDTFIIQVSKVTAFDGKYDLHISLIEPTIASTATQTPTPLPTATPQPTDTPVPAATPWPTHTPQPQPTAATQVWPTHTPSVVWSSPTPAWATHTPVWPTHTPIPQPAATTQSVGGSLSGSASTSNSTNVTTSSTVTATISTTTIVTTPVPITTAQAMTLTIRHLGRVEAQSAETTTHIRLLVYYDANNDRTPSPGEGIPNVSVLAVDARGQRIARVFTNAQGDAVFNITSDSVARIVVPLVPSWSERIRVGEQNDNIVLGLPAVRLPVFLPVDMGEED